MAGFVASELQFAFHRSQLHRFRHTGGQASSKNSEGKAWALVTGASDGVGKACVDKLAGQGFNIILHGRNKSKLEDVVSAMRLEHPATSFKLLVLDACVYDQTVFDSSVLDCVSGLHLTTIVHNVGGQSHLAPKQLRLFEEMSSDDIENTIGANARFASQLTRVLLPVLVKNQPALMLFISSGSSLIAVPYVSVYSGAKSYINLLADCLQFEFDIKGYDIEVQSIILGQVITKAINRREEDRRFDRPLAGEMVDAIISKVGWKKDVVIAPYVGHRPLRWIPALLPKSMLRKLMITTQAENMSHINRRDKVA